MTAAELNTRLEAYLALREALGFVMLAERTLLREFVRYVSTQCSLEPIRASTAVEWACSSSTSRGAAGQSARLTMARRFLHHLKAAYPQTEVPEKGLLAAPRRCIPYLFSDEEVKLFINAAHHAGPRGSLRSYTLATLIDLLFSTGLRIGEAVRLTESDLQLGGEPPYLVVRESKFGKSRFVPVHATTADMLRRYLDQRKAMRYDALSDAFLVSERGGHLRVKNVARWFDKQIASLRIAAEHGKRKPCLHSFRHTFAVRRIQAWYKEGADVQAMLPHLSIYLGHLNPNNTYWYLTATPQLLCSAGERFRRYTVIGGEA
jgi:integrase/recombinase XerD